MKNTLVGLGLLFVLAIGPSLTVAQIQARLGKTRPIPTALFGMNGNITAYDAPFDRPNVVADLKRLDVSLLRYPGGMIANHWNFETGGVDKSEPDSDMQPWIVANFKNSTRAYTLDNYAKGLKATGMAPLVVLNMLGKDLEHNLNVLRKLRDLGRPVRYVEMGNEYYFGLVKMKRVFPTPEDYGRTCQTWIAAIKKEFPETQCAIIGYHKNGDARNTNWTARVLSQCTNADAVTFHTYSALGLDGSINQPDLGLVKEQTTKNPTATRSAPTDMAERQRWEIQQLNDPKAVANSLSRVRTSANSLTKLGSPATMPVWITEFNMRADDSAIRGTWLNALQVSTFLTRFLEDPRVDMILFHNVYGNLFAAVYQNEKEFNHLLNEKIPSKPGTLSAGGLMMNLYAQAARNMTSATPLTFDNVPALTNDRGETVPGLIGWQFADGTKKRTLFVNQTDQSQMVMAALVGAAGAPVRFRQFHAPLATYVQGVESVKQTDGKTGRTVSLAPYSITIID
ncbi:MAG: hypothetical protein H7Z72_23100 [Bacteroidetes bacterium]|nr:hypothetical protein [Fibrella sp.]